MLPNDGIYVRSNPRLAKRRDLRPTCIKDSIKYCQGLLGTIQTLPNQRPLFNLVPADDKGTPVMAHADKDRGRQG